MLSHIMVNRIEFLRRLALASLLVSALSCSQFELRQSPSLRSVVGPSKGWRGLVVANENECTPYNRNDYRYSPRLEKKIIERNLKGQHYSPYTGEVFRSLRDSQIEHIVSTGEAHRSGLCAANAKTRLTFASDMDNLTLASANLNSRKSDKDAAKWVPPLNKCWFAWTVIRIKRRYGLTVDRREVRALDGILRGCPQK